MSGRLLVFRGRIDVELAEQGWEQSAGNCPGTNGVLLLGAHVRRQRDARRGSPSSRVRPLVVVRVSDLDRNAQMLAGDPHRIDRRLDGSGTLQQPGNEPVTGVEQLVLREVHDHYGMRQPAKRQDLTEPKE